MVLTDSWSEPLGPRSAEPWPGLLAPTAALPPITSQAVFALPGREGSVSSQQRLKGMHPWKPIYEVARLQLGLAFAGAFTGPRRSPSLGRKSNQVQSMRSEPHVVGRTRAGVSFGLGAGPSKGRNSSEGTVKAAHRSHIYLYHMLQAAPFSH